MPLKVELHAHTSDDPADPIPHSTAALIDRAVALHYDALAITLHDKQLDLAPVMDYAAARHLVLIPGVEKTIEGRHVLLLNFSGRAESIDSFSSLADLKRAEAGLVVAPHAFFPLACCVGPDLEDHADLFDAVEVNAMHVRGLNFNRRAIEWARQHGKPLVGNGDIHRLSQLGTTYSLVDAEPDPQAICDAIRAGRVQVRTEPLGWYRAFAIFAALMSGDLLPPTFRRR